MAKELNEELHDDLAAAAPTEAVVEETAPVEEEQGELVADFDEEEPLQLPVAEEEEIDWDGGGNGRFVYQHTQPNHRKRNY